MGLKLLHWGVIALSLAITLFAWLVTSKQVQDNNKAKFQREVDHTVDAVVERMVKYEDILWSGVATLNSHTKGFDRNEFKTFSEQLDLVKRYPGINGIGVIYHVAREDQQKFLDLVRVEKPGFKIFPQHSIKELLPITYVEPEGANKEAIGLDMAHERNRYTAAKKAQISGEAQVTGPIVLVQDQEKTPGFLFYAPFYKDKNSKVFGGLVYAPFIFKKLMNGVLGVDNKMVDVTISDGNSLLYQDRNEHSVKDSSHFNAQKSIGFYGRQWSFDISSNALFHSASENNQPLVVLCAGILIDVLLFLLFVAMSRSTEQAMVLADQMVKKADEQTEIAVQSSKLASLGEMAGGIAHEINNPLAIISGNITRLKFMLAEDKLDPKKAFEMFNRIDTTVSRIAKIISSMRVLARDGSKDSFDKVSVRKIINDVVIVCTEKFKQHEVEFIYEEPCENLMVECRHVQVSQVLINLLNNAFDAVVESDEKLSFIKIQTQLVAGSVQILISNSGKTISPLIVHKIMEPFFTTKEVGKGTGLGLSISKKIIENHKGKLFVDTNKEWTTFVVELQSVDLKEDAVETAV